MSYSHIDHIQKELVTLQSQIQTHELYTKINSEEALHTFMEYHVFAVFDFMSLLKALQISLTQTQLPWVPKGNPKTRRFINEIVLGEESDVDADGNPMSHYEMYRIAMESCGANVKDIDAFVGLLSKGQTVSESLAICKLPEAIQNFVTATFEAIATNEPHKIAAVFTFGRENLIPIMFIEMVKGIREEVKQPLDKFIYYLERHIELDGDEHGPIALEMISELCGTDTQKWEECLEISKQALEQRLLLWDAISEVISECSLKEMPVYS